jgi:hypothetical protein
MTKYEKPTTLVFTSIGFKIFGLLYLRVGAVAASK